MSDPDIPRSGRGVVFVATGAGHVAAARAAAASVRRSNPGLGICLFADQAAPGPEFDRIAPIPNPRSRSKVDMLWQTPFAQTLFLDTDTRVLADLADMFRLLDRFPLAIAHVVRHHKAPYQRRWATDLPRAFPQHNSGVILFRSDPETIAFLQSWSTTYTAAGIGSDQVTLRELLWTSGLPFYVLPPVYNVRSYGLVERYLSDRPPPIILHLPRFNARKGGLAGLRRKLGLGG